MKEFIRNIFAKSSKEQFTTHYIDTYRFVLKIDEVEIGQLEVKEEDWIFRYSEQFRNQDRYRRLTGFSDLNKEYRSRDLWPFFKIRIPGLKQPRIKEIIEKEQIDQNNEALLLRRFGNKSLTNPYILEEV